MTRNTQRRVELACPIYDVKIRDKIHHILELCLADNIRARQLQHDGTYCQILDDHPPIDSQSILMEEAMSASQPVSSKKFFFRKLKKLL